MSDLNPIGPAGIGQSGFGQGSAARRGYGALRPRETESIELPSIDELGVDELGAAGKAEVSFSNLLTEGVRAVSERQQDAKDTIANFAAGKGAGVHDVMMAMGKSEIAFAMMLEVRNRLVDAWREVTRIQV